MLCYVLYDLKGEQEMRVAHLAHIRPLEHVALPTDYFQRCLLHSFKKSVMG